VGAVGAVGVLVAVGRLDAAFGRCTVACAGGDCATRAGRPGARPSFPIVPGRLGRVQVRSRRAARPVPSLPTALRRPCQAPTAPSRRAHLHAALNRATPLCPPPRRAEPRNAAVPTPAPRWTALRRRAAAAPCRAKPPRPPVSGPGRAKPPCRVASAPRAAL